MVFLPTVAHAFSQSEDKIGTQLIFPIPHSHLWKPKKFWSCHQSAYYFVCCFPPEQWHQDELICDPCCHFSLFSVCKMLMTRGKLEQAPSMSAAWTHCRSRLAGNKTSLRRRFSTVGTAFALQFAITNFKGVFYKFLRSEHWREKYLFILPTSYSQTKPYGCWGRGGNCFIVLIPLKQQHLAELQDDYGCCDFFALLCITV